MRCFFKTPRQKGEASFKILLSIQHQRFFFVISSKNAHMQVLLSEEKYKSKRTMNNDLIIKSSKLYQHVICDFHVVIVALETENTYHIIITLNCIECYFHLSGSLYLTSRIASPFQTYNRYSC